MELVSLFPLWTAWDYLPDMESQYRSISGLGVGNQSPGGQ